MASQWFIRGGGKVYGPLDEARLRQLAAVEKINESTDIARNATGPWCPAGRVRGLFNGPNAAMTAVVSERTTDEAPPATSENGTVGPLVRTPSGPSEDRLSCPTCDNRCAANASSCPQCGHRFPRIVPWLAASLTVGLVLICAAGTAFILRHRHHAHHRQEVDRLEAKRLDAERRENDRRNLQEAVNLFIHSLAQPAQEVTVVRKRIAEALQAGVPGTFRLGLAADTIAKDLERSRARVTQALDDESHGKLGLEAVADTLASAKEVVDRGKQRLVEIRAPVQEAAAVSKIDAHKLFPTIVERTRKTLAEAGASTGLLSRCLRELGARQETSLANVQASPESVDARNQAEEELIAITEEARAIELAALNVKAASEHWNQALQEIQGNLRAAQRGEEFARRKWLGNSTESAREDLAMAKQSLENQETLLQQAVEAVAEARTKQEQEALREQRELLRQKAPNPKE